MKVPLILIILICFILFAGCEIIQYSPYQTNLDDSSTGLLNKNLDRISILNQSSSGSFKYAVIADNHANYDDFVDAVKHISQNTEISFVIHVGDMTELGLKKEYEWVYEILSMLAVPYFTVIGNHDCLSNGDIIYRNMFGRFDYSFTFHNAKFVVFNTNTWEFKEGVPNFDWMETELSSDSSYDQIFVFAHVPPFGDQMQGENENQYRELLAGNNIDLSIHGHEHKYSCDEHYSDGVVYLVVDHLGSRNYCIISVNDSSFEISRIFY